tara:strand:+ start:212 stop:1120 length:909 start_codon:yes stop_codon:yes gene_type:complete
MATATAGTLAAISGAASLAGAGLSIGQMISGTVKKNDAQQALNQSITDLRATIKEGQANRMAALQVPTKGAELRERALARSTSGALGAAQETGAAGVIGSAGRLQVAADEQAAQIMSDLDKSIAERDRLVLGQEQAIEAERYKGLVGLGQMEMQGAQQAVADAQAQVQAGAAGLGSSLTNVAGIAADAMNPYGKTKNTTEEGIDNTSSLTTPKTTGSTTPTFTIPSSLGAYDLSYDRGGWGSAVGWFAGNEYDPTAGETNADHWMKAYEAWHQQAYPGQPVTWAGEGAGKLKEFEIAVGIHL